MTASRRPLPTPGHSSTAARAVNRRAASQRTARPDGEQCFTWGKVRAVSLFPLLATCERTLRARRPIMVICMMYSDVMIWLYT